MTLAMASRPATRDPIAAARLHGMLRFAVGITIAFVLAEYMGWFPTFLAPVLFATLATSLPVSPPFKVGVILVVVMAAAAAIGFLLPSVLSETPEVLLGSIALIIFLAFATMAQGRGKLPATLLLLCVATIPVIAMTAPAQAGVMPTAMIRAMTVAMLIVWAMFALWPRVLPPAPPPRPPR